MATAGANEPSVIHSWVVILVTVDRKPLLQLEVSDLGPVPE